MTLDSLDPAFRAIAELVLKETIAATGFKWIATSCRRTIAEQNKLYAQGRTAPGNIVTNARGGSSPHNFGLAMDAVPIREGQCWWDAPHSIWKQYGDIAKERGLVWGGDFKSITDLPHIESADWRIVQALWKAGKYEAA